MSYNYWTKGYYCMFNLHSPDGLTESDEKSSTKSGWSHWLTLGKQCPLHILITFHKMLRASYVFQAKSIKCTKLTCSTNQHESFYMQRVMSIQKCLDNLCHKI